MKTDFILIDFENVQPKDLALLNTGSHKIKVFLGPHQGKIPVTIARALQAFGSDVEYIEASGRGNNAVDFHIAYYIGRLAATTSDTRFHVISKDAGFDPLIAHLKEQGIFASVRYQSPQFLRPRQRCADQNQSQIELKL